MRSSTYKMATLSAVSVFSAENARKCLIMLIYEDICHLIRFGYQGRDMGMQITVTTDSKRRCLMQLSG